MLEHISESMIIEHKYKLPTDFNWLAVLKDLANGATLTVPDYRKLRLMAGRWPTCACGQLCQSLPRHIDGGPRDTILMALGTLFYHRVETQKWKEAMAIFLRIEERVGELLGI